MARPKTVHEYIAKAPKEAQKRLKEIRATLRKVAPGATEAIKWGAPTFAYKRILFAYAGYKNHVSLMPTPDAMKPYKKELAKYKTGRGSIQFPLDISVPAALIKKIAAYRVKQSKKNDVRWM